MKTTEKAVQRLLKLHLDSEKYYGHCAAITTEQDLKILFEDLATYRKELANNLLTNLEDRRMKRFWREDGVWSHLHTTWKDVKLALIVNNREKILAIADRTERGTLKECHLASLTENLPVELSNLIAVQMEEVKRKIEQINAMPRQKFMTHKSLAM